MVLISISGLLGCARSKPVETASRETQRSVDSNPAQLPAVDSKPQQAPATSPIPTKKSQAAQADSPKAKTNTDVPPPPEAVAHKEKEPKIAAKEEATEVKPSEMKVANGFEKNTYLASVVKPLLPPRTGLPNAAAGFKKERDFIVVLHLSKNLVISFYDIKTRVSGHHRMSLSDALRDIRPSITKNMAKAEVNKAELQAKDDESRARDEAKKAATQDKLANNRKS